MVKSLKIAVFCTSLAFFLLAPGLSAQSARGEISYRDKNGKVRSERGEILKHTYRGLVMKRRGGQRTVSEDQLISVSYARKPDGYEGAMEFFEQGSNFDAIDALIETLTAIDKKKSLAWAKQEVLYHASEAAFRAGDYATAEKYAKDLTSTIRDTRYLPHLELRAAGVLLARGKFKEAIAAFETVRAAASKGYSTKFVIAAAIGQVRAHLRSGKPSAAAAAAKAAAGLARNSATKDLVAAWNARVLVAQKKYADASNQLTNLMRKASANKRYQSEPTLLAAAANGLGDIAFEQGDFEKAAMEYSKTFALFGGQAGLDHYVGWATWQFSLCCKRIATTTKDEEKRKVYTLRHRRMRGRAAEDYAMTRGGQLARKELGLN